MICEQDSISNDVFPLTMNLFDRYCSSLTHNESSVIKSIELIALSCYQIAKKIRYTLISSKQNHKISLILNDYTDDEIFDAEQTICDKLGWDLASIIPHDYVDPILEKLPFTEMQRMKLKQHVEILLCLCTCEYECSMILPSLIACGCITSAVHGLYSQLDLIHDDHLLSRIIKSTKNDIDNSQMIVEQIVQIRLQDLHIPPTPTVETHGDKSPSSRRCLVSIENNQNSPKTPKRTSFCIVR
ncbi:unnamed protein product [Didymodactylos carnosus]|uniref:Cyclin D2 n=1 Tax=Didymodactylos carnosus TaxID=1234261 RepID=A0A814D2T1_9BILA|nr:unnamed protein product [Didymodactylos carnosus]CAF0947671.1 unnamed protein product [Didymodactylos carnosus]CAF3552788.1 unnamed protein product [Didymodactylos carnosus]CAF3723711.1 unnamed protein product [Didymodactylos carnosus]